MFHILIVIVVFSVVFLVAIEGGYLNVSAQKQLISVPFVTKITLYGKDDGILKYETYKQIINGTDRKDFLENFRKTYKLYEPEHVTSNRTTGAVFINAINGTAAFVPADRLTNDTYVDFVNRTVFPRGIYSEGSEGEWKTDYERCFFNGIGITCQKGLPVHYLAP